MTGRSRLRLVAVLALVVVIASGFWLLARRATQGASTSNVTAAGGRLVATMRGEPTTFNRFVGTGMPTDIVAMLTQSRLVRINRSTHELEPALASSWRASDDGLEYALQLREASFSDGHPFTADDVLFSFAAAYDERTASPLGSALLVDGRPLQVAARSPREIVVRFPRAYGPGLRILDNLPIYPRHLLQAALESGAFRTAWSTATPPDRIAGLGPFVLTSYEPARRLVFGRNAHYWLRDERGGRLPYLDQLVLEIAADQNSELLRLQAGQVDLLQNELRPEDYLPIKQRANRGLRLETIGPTLDSYLLWFNMARPTQADRAWLGVEAFRFAVAHAVDRRAFVDTVYLGAADPAWGFVSASNTIWFAKDVAGPVYDPARASTLLASLNLADRNGDGVLDDDAGRPVRFAMFVQKGVTASENGAAFIRQSLARVGVQVDVVPLDLGSMMSRWGQGDYDAIYHLFSATDTDPAGNLDFWLSSGSAHLWHPSQPQPATPWEARMDTLMERQTRAIDPVERQRLFAEVQRIFMEHLPAQSFATPHVHIATSARVANDLPAVQRPQLLWSAERLAARSAPVP
jgi:peptide/nickel transport system substrate-binding protein